MYDKKENIKTAKSRICFLSASEKWSTFFYSITDPLWYAVSHFTTLEPLHQKTSTKLGNAKEVKKKKKNRGRGRHREKKKNWKLCRISCPKRWWLN